MTDIGRVPEGTGLSQQDAEPVSRLGPSGFDPSRRALVDRELLDDLCSCNREQTADLISALADALDQCRAIIKFHVKPERCVSRGGEVLSAGVVFENTIAVLARARGEIE